MKCGLSLNAWEGRRFGGRLEVMEGSEIRAWVAGRPDTVVTLEELQWTGDYSGSIVTTFRQRWHLLEVVYPMGSHQMDGRSFPRLSTGIPPFTLIVDNGVTQTTIRGLQITGQLGPNFSHQTSVELLFTCREVSSQPIQPSSP